MKILCVVPSYHPAFKFGGPIFSVHKLNKALVKKGIEVTVYTTNVGLGKTGAKQLSLRGTKCRSNPVFEIASSPAAPRNDGEEFLRRRAFRNDGCQEVDVDGVRVFYFGFSKLFEFLGATGWQFSMPMTRALKANMQNFDVAYIVAIWNYPIAIAAHYCRKYGKPYVVSPRGTLYPYATGKKFWKKRIYYTLVSKKDVRGAGAIHYTTEDEADKCHSFLRLNNRAVVISNGIDVSEFMNLPPKEQFKSHYPFLKDKKIILFLGRLNWKKGLNILTKAYGKITQERNDVYLVIAGNDESGYEKKVKRWIKDYGVEGKVTWTGMLTGGDKLEAYAGSDIFVLPSYSENFGMSVVEAMACGLPVIISNQVGIHKEVTQAKAGIIIDTQAEQLAEALRSLLDNADMCKNMGENGRRLVEDKFSLDKAADEMIKIYRNIIYGK